MTQEPAVVILTNDVTLPASFVLWSLQNFKDIANIGKRLAVVTQATKIGDLKLDLSSLDAIICISQHPGYHLENLLADATKVLKPGGVLMVHGHEIRDDKSKEHLGRSLLLSGYVNMQLSVAHLDDGSNFAMLKANKPTWGTGASFSLKKKLTITADSGDVGPVKLHALDVENDYEYIDEDSLLTEEDLKRPELPKADDCEVGKSGRKACKNCTCGRAEMENSVKVSLTTDENSTFQSACGNCGLGDAFRCSTCPYRGMPAFKPGEKITLSGMLLKADV